MSATAIRRALGLSEAQALAAGLVEPRTANGAPGPVRAPAQGPGMAAVVDAVARVTGFGREQLLGRGQARSLARARHLAMYLVRELCPRASLPAIGCLLGRDHTTVLYGCRRARALLGRDAAYREWHKRACSDLGVKDRDARQGREPHG